MNFEQNRFTERHKRLTIATPQSIVEGATDHGATDQKVPKVIEPIPDEQEEFGLRDSIGVKGGTKKIDKSRR